MAFLRWDVQKNPGTMKRLLLLVFFLIPLGGLQADIVRYSVGWYGPNEAEWFGRSFPSRAVIPYGFVVVVANWASPGPEKSWPGRGHSCILTRDGKVLAMSRAVCGNDIVLADLEIKKRRKAP